MKIIKSAAVFILAFSAIGLNAQDLRTVSGIVTSFRTIPLKNATVFAIKSRNSVLTDSTGRFSIECDQKDILRISASGFVNRNQKVGDESTYKIDLSYVDNIKNFNEAIDAGHISEKVLRDALFKEESRNAKDYSKYHNIYELVASEIYNVRVKGNTVVNTKIRNFDTTPEVLLVVDNKIVRDISFVSTDDVKSVEFIDDVSASIYGSMGANGVLKITLK